MYMYHKEFVWNCTIQNKNENNRFLDTKALILKLSYIMSKTVNSIQNYDLCKRIDIFKFQIYCFFLMKYDFIFFTFFFQIAI